MLLQVLKTKLQIVTGTDIGEVIFDWKTYLNVMREKTYPLVLWSLGGAKFQTDARTATIQKTKILTLTVFAIARYDPNTQDKIDVWDTLEGYFDVYLNAMNETSGIQIMNIDNIKGEYVPEGMISADQEIGIMVTDLQLKMFC